MEFKVFPNYLKIFTKETQKEKQITLPQQQLLLLIIIIIMILIIKIKIILIPIKEQAYKTADSHRTQRALLIKR